MQQAKIDGEKIITVEGIADGKLECFYLGRIPGLDVGVYFLRALFSFSHRSISRKQNQKLRSASFTDTKSRKFFKNFILGTSL